MVLAVMVRGKDRSEVGECATDGEAAKWELQQGKLTREL